MTTEERRYIIREYRRGRTYADIAEEMGRSPAWITLDRNRHADEWELYERWLELNIKSEQNRFCDDVIKEYREKLRVSESKREECLAQRDAFVAEALNITGESYWTFLKNSHALEVELARNEVLLHGCLADWLSMRYDLE